MQTIQTTNAGNGIRAELDRLAAKFARGFNRYIETLSRARELERLNALSDRQLADMGLRREDIVRHVFRDKMSA